jgi:glycosyltransferase involved in cell wall biosynthesis
MMAGCLPVVSVFGVENIDLKSGLCPPFETDKFDVKCHLTDDGLIKILAEERPGVIVTFGDVEDFQGMLGASFEMRKRWLHYENTSELLKVGMEVMQCYASTAILDRRDIKLVTVFTPAYNAGERIMRPYLSLKAQAYRDWEWVVIDDSDDGGETFKKLSEIADSDYRVRVFKESRHSGVIGRLKRNACMLGRGEFLVELDHDDELTEDSLARVVDAYEKHPEVGFVYTDFAELFPDGSPVRYGQDLRLKPPFTDWGFGYGSYRDEVHEGQHYAVANSPNINAKTIRHIVAAPNHLRSWRKTVYEQIGGHRESIHVADDYEIMVRTFLATRMARVPHMCYLQYRNPEGNTHRDRNQEIQRLVRCFSQFYDDRIHARLLELGVVDYVWKEGQNTFARMGNVPNPPEESHCTITIAEEGQ